MSSPFWFALYYTSAAGERLRCFNLQLAGAVQIEQVQRGLGSHSFERVPQPRHHSQQELDGMHRAGT